MKINPSCPQQRPLETKTHAFPKKKKETNMNKKLSQKHLKCNNLKDYSDIIFFQQQIKRKHIETLIFLKTHQPFKHPIRNKIPITI